MPLSTAAQRPGAIAHEREPAGEGSDVGERAVGLEPGVGRGRRDQMIESAVKTASAREREQREPAVQPARQRAG